MALHNTGLKDAREAAVLLIPGWLLSPPLLTMTILSLPVILTATGLEDTTVLPAYQATGHIPIICRSPVPVLHRLAIHHPLLPDRHRRLQPGVLLPARHQCAVAMLIVLLMPIALPAV